MSPILKSQAGLHLSPILTSQAEPPMFPTLMSQAEPPMFPILMSQAGLRLSHILASPATPMQPPRSATVISLGTDTLRAAWDRDMAATINDATKS